jgi:PII-like signaling protein
VSGDLAKLTTYFGERDRSGGELLADELFALYGREGVELSAMLRGIEGFGHRHSAHSELLLTLSDDLPVVSVAVDTADRIEALMPLVLGLKRRGLVTLERARPLGGPLPGTPGSQLPDDLREQAKLTVFIGRRQRAAGRPAFVSACELLHEHGVHGATVLLGVDGTTAGTRTRARLFGRNVDVPMLVISVGPGEAIAHAAAALDAALDAPVMTLERVRVLRRDGERLAALEALAPVLEHDVVWAQKLTVHSSEDDSVDGHPLHRVLVQRLRRERLAGATTLRGVYGFHGDRRPRGDRFWQTRRRAPMMTIAVDTHERIAEVFGVVEQVTSESGLVTVETVPVRVLPEA